MRRLLPCEDSGDCDPIMVRYISDCSKHPSGAIRVACFLLVTSKWGAVTTEFSIVVGGPAGTA